jgi:hypothetical protein
MARQTINTGTTANDGSGDTLRVAGTKINENFVELYTTVGGGVGNPTRLTDSGVTFLGLSYNTRLGFVEGASLISIDLPNTSGVLLVDTATQTITNKTISADDNSISGLPNSSFVVTNGSGVINGAAAAKTIPVGDVIGSTDAQTMTNKVLTRPTIYRPNIHQSLRDSDGSDIIKIVTVGSANSIQISNATTSNKPIIEVAGDDANIGLDINAKGTGQININSSLVLGNNSIDSAAPTLAAYMKSPLTIFNHNASISATMPDGTTIGQKKTFVNKNTGAATITKSGSNLGPHNTFAVARFGSASLVWDGSEWIVLNDPTSTYLTFT